MCDNCLIQIECDCDCDSLIILESYPMPKNRYFEISFCNWCGHKVVLIGKIIAKIPVNE
jgi:hypothetical protein